MSGEAPGTTVAIIGAGLMGSQIGCEYALGGHPVVWIVRDRERARARIDAALQVAHRYGLADAEALAAASARISVRESFSGEEPVELIVESVIEQRDVKVALLRDAGAWRPAATIATNSSSIGVSELGRLGGIEERIVATHYWNPPLLMAQVEVLAGERTATERLERVVALLRAIGKRPIELSAEVPGLLWNRLQLAVLRESLWLVENGVATPEAIDEVMRDGLARRWRLTGPFETVSLGGAPVFDAIAANLFPVLSNAQHSDGFAPHLIDDGQRLAELRARRDEALAAQLMAERAAAASPLSAPSRPS
jgi:3-hydroxybutyryl-CoA dehydrogenase